MVMKKDAKLYISQSDHNLPFKYGGIKLWENM